MKFAFWIALFFSIQSFAIDAVVPKTLCDRFLNPLDQKKCEQKIEKMNPDSYLAALCAHQFDDDQFYKCMELSQKFQIDPRQLAFCDDDSLTDQTRILCIQKQFNTHKSVGKRIPANSHVKTIKKH